MTKNWIVVPPPGVSFDAKTGNISLADVGVLATAWIDQEGKFNIWLSNMETAFTSDSEEIKAVGYNGCENHMDTHVWMHDLGGTLEYQKNRCNFLKERGEKISIKIIIIEGEIIPLHKPPVKSRWEEMVYALKEIFNPWPRKAET